MRPAKPLWTVGVIGYMGSPVAQGVLTDPRALSLVITK